MEAGFAGASTAAAEEAKQAADGRHQSSDRAWCQGMLRSRGAAERVRVAARSARTVADWVLALQATALPCLFVVVVRVVVLALVMMMREVTSRFAFLSSGPGALRRGLHAILSIPHPSRLSLSWPGRGNQSYPDSLHTHLQAFWAFCKFRYETFLFRTKLN